MTFEYLHVFPTFEEEGFVVGTSFNTVKLL